jgi:hypothetical protein
MPRLLDLVDDQWLKDKLPKDGASFVHLHLPNLFHTRRRDFLCYFVDLARCCRIMWICRTVVM